jgi:hypothetical protein
MKLRKTKKPITPESRRTRLRSEQPPTNPAAYSYYARRSEQQQSTGRQLNREGFKPAIQRARHFWLQRYGLVVLLIVAVISAVNVLSLSTNPKIEQLQQSSSTPFLQPASVYQQAGSALLKSSILNRNKVTINSVAISDSLLAKFPELASVSISLPLLAHRPVIYLQPAQPALILHASNGSFLVAENGKALIAGTSFTGFNVPQVADQSTLAVKLNQQALTSDNVAFIQTIVAQLSAKKVFVGTMSLPAATSELDVFISGQPYFVKFNLESNDAKQQAGTFLAVQAHLASQGITPTKYIDVRVDGRAYYE